MDSCLYLQYFLYTYIPTPTRPLYYQHIKNNSLWTKIERLVSSPGRYQVNTVVDKRFVASGLGAKNQASEDRCC